MNKSPSRALSGAELTVAALLIIAHHVYHLIPEEKAFLFVVGVLSFQLRDGSWAAMGLIRPKSWLRTVGLALGVAAICVILGDFVVFPVAQAFWPPPIEPAMLGSTHGDLKAALLGLLLVWTSDAFGEEIVYRGYLLGRAADIGGRSRTAYWIGSLVVASLFGLGHFYKGPSGIIEASFVGLILGAAYLLSGRNLWVCILAHGFINTVAVIAAFLGSK